MLLIAGFSANGAAMACAWARVAGMSKFSDTNGSGWHDATMSAQANKAGICILPFTTSPQIGAIGVAGNVGIFGRF